MLLFLSALLGTCPALLAGTATFDFSTDPRTDSRVAAVVSNNPKLYQTADGNPDGFLSLTEAVDSLSTVVVFKDIDNGAVVKGFKLSADLRVGNSEGDRGADGFSISYARAGDPILEDPTDSGFAAGLPEAGTTTGIAIGFDSWSGNTLPDGRDLEGLIVRVDNVTVLRKPFPTRNGACGDATSMQTGASANDGGVSTATLCWAPLSVELEESGKLTVSWKGQVMLDGYQTSYFPSRGQLVLASRTGGENQKTHVDNLKLVTIAAVDEQPPSDPGPAKVESVGSRSLTISWGASTDNIGLVAYNVFRDGELFAQRVNTVSYTDRSVHPLQTYQYKVQAVDIAGQNSPGFSNEINATTIADADSPGFLFAEIYDHIFGSSVQALYADPRWKSRAYNRGAVLNGLSFGEPALGDTFGENLAVVVSGTITAPETAQYDFFVRSDDTSEFYLNPTGPSVPTPDGTSFIATETTCCNPFLEPGSKQTTASPIFLTAGQQYGFTFVVKEGGGGDWGQVAIRKLGDPTPAAQLAPIRGLVSGKVDPNGAALAITAQPADVKAVEGGFATFTVAAEGDSPQFPGRLVYQWYRNGIPILGENSSTYTRFPVGKADDGAKFKCQVAVAGKGLTSREATLRVTSTNGKLSQSITFPPIPDQGLTVGQFTLHALSDSGLPVLFSLVSGPATVTGDQVTLTGLGTVVLRAYQPGDATYDPAPDVLRSFVIRSNSAPVIAPVPDGEVVGSQVVQVSIVITDVETPNGPFTISAISLTPDLVLPSSLILGGEGAARLLAFAAQEGKSGPARLRVTVTDVLGGSASTEFTYTIRRPTIFKPVSDLVVEPGPVIGPIRVELADQGDLGPFNWTVSASNADLFPANGILMSPNGLSCSFLLVPAAGVTGTSTIIVSVGDGKSSAEVRFQITVARPNHPPQIGVIPDRTVTAGRSVVASFTVSDAETVAEKLILRTESSRPDLVPPGNLGLGGVGSARTISLNTLPDREGQCVITITARDEAGAEGSRAFNVTVRPNTPPQITLIPDLTMLNSQGATISFGVSDVETAPQLLKVSVASENVVLLGPADLVLSGTGGERVLSIPAVPGRVGACQVTLKVEDDLGGVVTTQFTITLTAPLPVPPSVKLLAPVHGPSYEEGDQLVLEAEVHAGTGEVALVEFLDGDKPIHSLAQPTALARLVTSALALGRHQIRVRAVDAAGLEALSEIYSLEVVPKRPPNDAFAQRADLSTSPLAVSTMAATREPGEPSHAATGSGPSLWYRWSIPFDARVRFATTGNDFDTVLAAYTGATLDSLVEVAANDNDPTASNGGSSFVFDATAGLDYSIVLAGAAGSSGLATLGWSVVEPLGKPLQIQVVGADVTLVWPAAISGAVVEFSPGLGGAGGWSAVTELPTRSGGRNTLKVPLSGDAGYYRLRLAQ